MRNISLKTLIIRVRVIDICCSIRSRETVGASFKGALFFFFLKLSFESYRSVVNGRVCPRFCTTERYASCRIASQTFGRIKCISACDFLRRTRLNVPHGAVMCVGDYSETSVIERRSKAAPRTSCLCAQGPYPERT